MTARVKTLHPRIHAGILFRRDLADHLDQMKTAALGSIDLVCVNLYAFEATVSRDGVTLDEAIENIDIGGPTLLRAAAKNYRSVTVVVDPNDYASIVKEMRENNGATRLKTRFELSKKSLFPYLRL